VSENRSVLTLGTEGLLWQAGGVEPRSLDDAQTRQALRAETARRDHRVVFAAPGGDVRLTELALAPEERRHLDTSLPFMLEESVAEDVEALHFARELIGRDRCAVAIVARTWMERWSEELGEFAARVPWIPEPLLLPWAPGEWTLVFDGASVLLRTGAYAGTRIEATLLPMLLASLAAEAAPAQVVLYGSDEAAERLLLPESLRDAAQWRRGGLGAALLLADSAEPRLELRQGDFAPRLPYQRWWAQWRVAAAVFALAAALHLLGGWLDLRRLEADNLALRGEIQQIYRSVNPRGAVVDAEKQLRRQLDALGGGDAVKFSSLLAPLGQLMAAQGDTVLASLNYSQSSGELRGEHAGAGF
jgi:general secretion pathway protein L